MKVSVIIVAAGKGVRMGLQKPKQFLDLDGKPLICHTLEKFRTFNNWDIIIVIAKEFVEGFKSDIIKKYGFPSNWKIVAGGIERQDSVVMGFERIADDTDVVLVHDGVRPFITEDLLKKSAELVCKKGAVLVASKVIPTIKEVENGVIVKTIDRKKLWEAQTPQGFRYDLLKRAIEKARQDNFYGTDECILVERIGEKIFILEGDQKNIKITRPEDISFAEAILGKDVR